MYSLASNSPRDFSCLAWKDQKKYSFNSKTYTQKNEQLTKKFYILALSLKMLLNLCLNSQ